MAIVGPFYEYIYSAPVVMVKTSYNDDDDEKRCDTKKEWILEWAILVVAKCTFGIILSSCLLMGKLVLVALVILWKSGRLSAVARSIKYMNEKDFRSLLTCVLHLIPQTFITYIGTYI